MACRPALLTDDCIQMGDCCLTDIVGLDCNSCSSLGCKTVSMYYILQYIFFLVYNNNNNNNNIYDNVYGAVIMAEPLQEFTRFI